MIFSSYIIHLAKSRVHSSSNLHLLITQEGETKVSYLIRLYLGETFLRYNPLLEVRVIVVKLRVQVLVPSLKNDNRLIVRVLDPFLLVLLKL